MSKLKRGQQAPLYFYKLLINIWKRNFNAVDANNLN